MKGAKIGPMRDRVVFDYPTTTPDGSGGTEAGWSALPNSLQRWAEFIYQRGNEAVDAGRLAGSAIYKVRIRQSVAARAITPAWRMRDSLRGTIYNIREVDSVTNRRWVYLVVEANVST